MNSEDPRAVAQRKIEAVGIETIIDKIIEGAGYRSITKEIGVSLGVFAAWLAADPERQSRAREARSMAGQAYEERAEQEIADAADPFELAKAKELALHLRWRAKAVNPRQYGDKVQVDQTVTVNELPDDELAKKRAAIAAELERLKALAAPEGAQEKPPT